MIIIGSDHAGIELKEKIINYFKKEHIEYLDVMQGVDQTGDDYPDVAKVICLEVLKSKNNLGIAICGTGIGIGIAANKVPGIRAALCSDTFSAHATREHNDANILTMGERVVGKGLAIDIVKAFLGAKFEGDRHARRINKITEIEKKYSK